MSFDFNDLGAFVLLIGVEDYPLPSFSPRTIILGAQEIKVYTKNRLLEVSLGYRSGHTFKHVIMDVTYLEHYFLDVGVFDGFNFLQ